MTEIRREFDAASGIHIKKSHEGMFHRDTGTPAGQPIPESAIREKLHSPDPAVRKRANFAENAKHWHH
jgi:hypothetical protein